MTTVALVFLLLIAGLILLAIEILVIPGFGLIGVLGCLGVLAGSTLAWVKLGPTWGILAIAAGIAVTGLMFWVFPRTRAGKALVLDVGEAGMRAGDPRLAELVGADGEAVTPLRPSGTAVLADRTVDVVTEGIYVDSGARVRVVRVEGSRVVVEPVPDPAPRG